MLELVENGTLEDHIRRTTKLSWVKVSENLDTATMNGFKFAEEFDFDSNEKKMTDTVVSNIRSRRKEIDSNIGGWDLITHMNTGEKKKGAGFVGRGSMVAESRSPSGRAIGPSKSSLLQEEYKEAITGYVREPTRI